MTKSPSWAKPSAAVLRPGSWPARPRSISCAMRWCGNWASSTRCSSLMPVATRPPGSTSGPKPIPESARYGARRRSSAAPRGLASGELETAGVPARIGDIDCRRSRKSRDLFGGKIAHDARRRTQDHLSLFETLAFGDERAGAHQRARPDAGPVEQDRAHADQRAITDNRRMHDDAMTDGHALADRHRLAGIGMDHAVILDIGILANRDPFIVAAQYRAEPDTRASQETHLSDQHRVRCDPATFRYLRRDSLECVNRHASPLNFSLRENFTHPFAKKDTLKTGEVIRLKLGVRALVHLALRSPRNTGPVRRTPLPSHSPISTYRESSWPNAPCVRSHVTLPMPKRMCIRFSPAVQTIKTRAGRRTILMANSGIANM